MNAQALENSRHTLRVLPSSDTRMLFSGLHSFNLGIVGVKHLFY